MIQSSVLGSSYTSLQSRHLTVFWDTSFFLVNKDDFLSVDGFEKFDPAVFWSN